MLIYVLLISQMCLGSIQDWPQEAKDYLNQIPEKKLTLQYVVGRAVAESDVFRLHKTEYLKGDVQLLSALSAEDTKITSSLFFTRNENEPIIPQFMATSTEGWEAKMGFEQFLSTGTLVKADLSHSYQKSGFQTIPDLKFKESKLSFGLDQNLLSDLGGRSYRKLKKASQSASEATKYGVMTKIEDSVYETIQFYYQAWLKQQVIKNLQESLKRRQKLNRILQSQYKKRLVEASDALQVEGMVLNSQAELETNKIELQSMWEELVIQLKLPEVLLNVPAVEIPLELDHPESVSTQLCKSYQYTDIEKNSNTLKQMQNLITSTKNRYEGLLPKLLPDVHLQANFTANGIDPRAQQTWEELADLQNPAVNVGVSMSLPLQNRQYKSEILMAKIEFEQAQTNQSIIKNNMLVRWRILCGDLAQKIANRDRYKAISSTNSKRVNMDHRRFELGRIKAFQWVQTEDDESNSSLRYQQSEIEVRLLAWEVQKLTGHLLQQAKKILKVEHE